jgi:S-formylglutathione hydrolase FrmB
VTAFLQWVTGTRLEVWTKLVPIDAVTAVLALLVLLPALRRSRGSRADGWRRARTRLIAVLIGAGVGLVACWIAGDLLDVFDVSLSTVTRMWVAIAVAGTALGIVGLVQGHWRRRVVGALLVPAVLLTAALGINVDFAAYPTLNALLQTSPVPFLPLAPVGPAATAPSLAAWRPPVDMPTAGLLTSVRIPPTRSHFAARPAIVYLPPAARTADPPRLPVILALSGQPGSPADMFLAGGLQGVLDRYAAAHRGIAPIVISVDHLGVPGHNPMCLDSPLGHVKTYLTEDVRSWALAQLPVDTGPWGVLGFSNGGTCTLQLGAERPDLFTTMLAISPERIPVDRSPENTIDEAFGGSVRRYHASAPAAILAAHRGHYRGASVVIVYGQRDREYAENAAALARATRRAGMVTRVLESPGTSHDWHTVQFALNEGVPRLAEALLGDQHCPRCGA